jgi:beta-phosphoglucomutase-like phosphatase (HAD superfamily)
MRFDGMIFDIEGTLIDCIPQNLQSWFETLSHFGITVPRSRATVLASKPTRH